jgi:deoxycytidylate deaminase
MNQIERGLSVALAASLLSSAPRRGLCMGAALFHGSRLLSVGANRWTTHPASNNEGFTRSLHAEHVALLRRWHYDAPSRMTLYVARKREDGTLGNSKPCDNCVRLCKLAGVRRIYFYNKYGESTYENL